MPTNVYTVYMQVPHRGWPGPYFDYRPDVERIEQALAAIQSRLGYVNFTGGDVLSSEAEVEAMRDKLAEADGILAFNLTSSLRGIFSRLVGLGLPTILFAQPYSGHEWALVAELRRRGYRVDVLATEDMSEIEGRMKLFDVIRRLKETRILYVYDGRGPAAGEYAVRVRRRVGPEILPIDHEQLVDAFHSVEEGEAEAEAECWIQGAERVEEPSQQEIVDASRMYLGIRRVMEEESAQAITINCLHLVYENLLPAYPCLAFSRLNDEGLTGVCEADMDSTLTQLIIGYLAGVPGFVSDPVFNTAQNEIIHAHCVAATRMGGPQAEPEPYIIRSHAEDDKGVSLQVRMRVGQAVTVAKLVNLEQMLISSGEIVDTPDVDRACRTKITTRVKDARRMLDNYRGGLHRVIFYGDHTQEVKNLGKLMGFEVVEEM